MSEPITLEYVEQNKHRFLVGDYGEHDAIFIWLLQRVRSLEGELARFNNFRPTPEQINALPEPLRRYIHDIETVCDPTGMVQQIASLTEQRDGLLMKSKELEGELAKERERVRSLTAQLRNERAIEDSYLAGKKAIIDG